MTAAETPTQTLRRAAAEARTSAQHTTSPVTRALGLKLANRFENEADRIERGDDSNADNALAAVRAFLGEEGGR